MAHGARWKTTVARACPLRVRAAMIEAEELNEEKAEPLATAIREIDAKKAAAGNDVVHYAPGHTPLCGEDIADAICTYEPAAVAGCTSCLELVAEDLADDSEYGGRCLHCRREITEPGGVQWRRSVRRICPHCGKAGW